MAQYIPKCLLKTDQPTYLDKLEIPISYNKKYK